MNRNDAAAAAQLIRHALLPSSRPMQGSDYRSLIDRYRTDVAFAEDVRAIAEGLGLYVRSATPIGLVIASDPDGPFRVTLDNCGLPLRSGVNRLADRRTFGLVLVALAAYAYPNGESLVETTNPTVRPVELERFITRHAASLAEAVDDPEAGPHDEMDVQLSEAARRWLDLPEVLPAERGGYRRDCRRAYVISALTFLVDAGRARRETALADERGDAFSLNDRFRIGFGEVAELLAFEILAAGASGGSGPGAEGH